MCDRGKFTPVKRGMLLAISGLLIFSLGILGCSYRGQETTDTQVNLLNTAAAQTVEALQTSIVQTSEALALSATPTFILEATDAVETPEPAPDHTPTITPTHTPQVKCDQAAFVSETIPDGSRFNPGRTFTKTWTIRNSGTCTWDANYDLVFVSGDAMGAPAAIQLTSEPVPPGDSVEIVLELRAPLSIGTHRGDFKLRNPNGLIFGIGPNAAPFWVEIKVEGALYNFYDEYCAPGVSWTSGAGELPCPGTPDDQNGWVIRYDEPILENQVVDDEPGLQVHPQMVHDGWIKGTFPSIPVSTGMYFRAIIGCYGAAECDVKFKLNYSIDGGPEGTLATWHEVQDGIFNRVEVSLSPLADNNVSFILLVEANGSPGNDEALWFVPRIEP